MYTKRAWPKWLFCQMLSRTLQRKQTYCTRVLISPPSIHDHFTQCSGLCVMWCTLDKCEGNSTSQPRAARHADTISGTRRTSHTSHCTLGPSLWGVLPTSSPVLAALKLAHQPVQFTAKSRQFSSQWWWQDIHITDHIGLHWAMNTQEWTQTLDEFFLA